MKLRPTKLSISATLKAHELGKEFSDAYLFVRQLRSQVKHPIILNYRSQLKHIADLINISEWKLRKSLNACIRLNLASIEGKNLRLHSNQQDWKFKPTKKNDYRVTSDPNKFRTLVLFRNHHNKQLALIKKKQRQQHERVNTSASNSIDNANPLITASVKSVAKMFHTKNLSTAIKLIKSLEKQGLIKIVEYKSSIDVNLCKKLLSQGKRNIRKIDSNYFRVNYGLQLNYSLKRVEFEPFYKLSEMEQATYLQNGYSIEQINRLLR